MELHLTMQSMAASILVNSILQIELGGMTRAIPGKIIRLNLFGRLESDGHRLDPWNIESCSSKRSKKRYIHAWTKAVLTRHIFPIQTDQLESEFLEVYLDKGPGKIKV
ncbi:hypothetical protein J6590_028009 [Homalodisca vitripennis]|nr:hypothetical protein J6590_028009 [Homalodisca vitripennis]